MIARTARRHAARGRALIAALLPFALCSALAACGGSSDDASSPMRGDEASGGAARPAVTAPASTAPAEDAAREADGPLVIVLGDSLGAGYRLPAEAAFPALLQATLREEGRAVTVRNASVSGDTTAGGLARLRWQLEQRPDVLVVELGGNDGLRGLPVASTAENLERIVVGAREAGARVLLLGMRMPPNLGPDYTRDFAAVYPELAERLDVPLVPFLLEGVAGDPALNLGDGIHPNAEGHRILAGNVLPRLRELLDGLPD